MLHVEVLRSLRWVWRSVVRVAEHFKGSVFKDLVH